METGMVFRTVFGKERWGSIFLMMAVKSLNAKAFADGDWSANPSALKT
jgi:hypothetical protein